MTRVSVILPTYNRKEMLLATLDSAFGRLGPDDEIVVVDDGSTDGTAQALAHPPDRVRVFSIENQGPAGARNVALREARGEYIAFLDSDDPWLPGSIDPQVEALAADEGLGLSCAGSRPVDANGHPTGPDRIGEDGGDDLVAELLVRNFVTTSTVVIPRRVLDDVGDFDEDLENSMDWDLWLRIAMDYRFHGLPDTVCIYLFHEDQRIKDLRAVHRCRARVLEKALHRCEKRRPDLVPLARRLLAYRFLRRGRYLLKQGDREAARGSFAEAIRHRPLTALTAWRYRLTIR